MGIARAPGPWTGSGAAPRRPHDPRQALVRARQSASCVTRRVVAVRLRDTAPTVSQENIEIVRRLWVEWGRGEVGLAVAAMDETVEWHMAEDEPDARTLHGRAEVKA